MHHSGFDRAQIHDHTIRRMKITAEQAIQRLYAPQEGVRRAKSTVPIQLVSTIKKSKEDRLYIFSRGGRAIIAPADDTLQPILGVCDNAEGEMPHAMRKYLNEIAHEVVVYQDTEEVGAAPTGRQSISPLVAAQWGQGIPWNKYLNFGDGCCLVGCNNIALGQIMYYWGLKGFHRGCKATTEYTTKTKKYAVESLPPITVFDYTNMVGGKPSTSKQKKAVGKMLEYITSAKVSTCLSVIKKTLNMGTNAKQVSAASLGAERFEQTIYDELVLGHPVYMAGYGSEGGHAFVCDGYDAGQDLFHFNWGYSGKYDGWFALSALKPGSHDYNSSKSAIVGIDPKTLLGDVNGDGKINISDVTSVISGITKGEYSADADINSDGVVDIKDVETLLNAILGKETL